MTILDLLNEHGPTEVARRSGVPRSTLTRYTDSGSSMMLDSAIKISLAYPGVVFEHAGGRYGVVSAAG